MNAPGTDPILLPANQPADRFYRGGSRISDFRSAPAADPFTPEDWVGSTTSVRGHAPVGQTRLPDGELLADAVCRDPLGWLGPAHVERFGADTMLLVKLLDAGQRLPIHAHPGGGFAAEHLAAAHGKAEAWYILTPGTVYLGLREPIHPVELRDLVDSQQTEHMLELMHAIDVAPNDTVYVPPGLLHAIGPGILLAEVQEPEDLSILLEWTGFELDGAADGHLGLGFELALGAVDTNGRSREHIRALVRHVDSDGPVLPAASAGYFRLDRVSRSQTLPAGFAIVIALEGSMTLTTERGAVLELAQGTTTLVPFAAGALSIDGHGAVLVARPPVVH
ncbi:class I mannose-6-phosphate isomerase [Lacisediminihabitans sp.]|uniref:class I mannose-6-phosphate isomerase n=1 Tax=Lacisediminihabitans sp. TaxID=2787631 RepID=UPI002F957A86